MLAWGPITVEGRVLPPGEKFINADERVVAGHYFETMQIPLLKGRFFNDQDTADKPPVILVDEFMAQQLWPNQDPTRQAHQFWRSGSPAGLGHRGWRCWPHQTRNAGF